MGTVKVYTTKTKGRMYEVWYTKPDGTRGHDRGFRLKRDADAHLATVEVSKLKGAYIDRADSKVTMAELGEDWLVRHKMHTKASTHAAVLSSWKTHVLPKWGHYPVGAVSKREIANWLGELGRRRGHTTVGRVRGILAGILDEAIEDSRILKNTARGVPIVKKPIPDEVYLSHAQAEALALTSRYPGLVRFLAYSGLRWGEATALACS